MPEDTTSKLNRLYSTLVLSEHWLPRSLRRARKLVLGLSVPTPKILLVPAISFALFFRSLYYFVARIFVCEPIFKFYCLKVGHNVHTGVYIPWIHGRGQLVVGDDVTIYGKLSITFSTRYVSNPTLTIGSNTTLGHDCRFNIGEQITIGDNCRIAAGTFILDFPGHPTDPEARLRDLPAPREKVRPVTIEDNVWVGTHSIILPGVTIGRNSVIGAGSVVAKSVADNTLVAGNPAQPVKDV